MWKKICLLLGYATEFRHLWLLQRNCHGDTSIRPSSSPSSASIVSEGSSAQFQEAEVAHTASSLHSSANEATGANQQAEVAGMKLKKVCLSNLYLLLM